MNVLQTIEAEYYSIKNIVKHQRKTQTSPVRFAREVSQDSKNTEENHLSQNHLGQKNLSHKHSRKHLSHRHSKNHSKNHSKRGSILHPKHEGSGNNSNQKVRI